MLIETILSSEKATDMVGRLGESEAQAFVDVVDEVRLHSFTPMISFPIVYILIGVGER